MTLFNPYSRSHLVGQNLVVVVIVFDWILLIFFSDDASDTEDEVTGQTSADNEPDTQETVDGSHSIAPDAKA